MCGDGILSVGEECDDGNTIDSDGCRNDCLNARCGDGVIRTDVGTDDDTEVCDDGNTSDLDDCTVHVGRSVVMVYCSWAWKNVMMETMKPPTVVPMIA